MRTYQQISDTAVSVQAKYAASVALIMQKRSFGVNCDNDYKALYIAINIRKAVAKYLLGSTEYTDEQINGYCDWLNKYVGLINTDSSAGGLVVYNLDIA